MSNIRQELGITVLLVEQRQHLAFAAGQQAGQSYAFSRTGGGPELGDFADAVILFCRGRASRCCLPWRSAVFEGSIPARFAMARSGGYAVGRKECSMPERFLSLIVTMLPAFQQIEQRLDRETGRRFNAFNLFAMNENATTRILAFLLDPTEAHGQKDVFLRLFIQRFVPDWKHVFKHRTAQKKSPSEANEAIDVTISDGSYWLGIENKIFDAPEQPQQAARYLNALRAATSSRALLPCLSKSERRAPD